MSETIGQQLKNARQAKGLTIQKVVQAIHIRAPHLEALEADDFESLPSPIQARAFLRLYADFLNLPLDEAISRQREGMEGIPPTPPQQAQDKSDRKPSSLNETVAGKVPDKITGLTQRLHSWLDRGDKLQTQPNPSTEVEEKSLDLDQSKPIHQDESSLDTALGEEYPLEPEAESPPSPPQPSQSQVIFTNIGASLRQRRESLSLTPEEVESHIHVRRHYLQALETGEFDALPSSVQARGMLANFAHFLDLDVDALLLRYADGLQLQRLERQSALEALAARNSPPNRFKFQLPKLPVSIRRFMSPDILVGGGLISLLIFFAVWGTGRILAQQADITPEATAPPISMVLVSSPESSTTTPSLSATPAVNFPGVPYAGETPVLTLPAPGSGAVNVVVIAVQQAWVRVTVDGKVKFEGRVTPGDAYAYDGNTQIEVLTGNGVAINILYNQSNLGPMGVLGEVVDRIYTSTAILLPTATFTPTPTITPTPTRTLRPTATLRSTATPRISPTPNP